MNKNWCEGAARNDELYNSLTGISSQKGDPDRKAILEAWVATHSDYLFRRAFMFVGRREVAEDVVQDTLLAAYASLSSFSFEVSERAWLRGILRYKIIDHLRQMSRAEQWYETSETTHDIDDQFFKCGLWNDWKAARHESPDEILQRKEFVRTLFHCVRRLPSKLRSVFLMKTIDEATTASIESTFQITPENIWVIIYRSRMKLRACVDKEWFSKT